MGSSENQRLVSVLINNYNYERYLGAAIDSALEQTYPHVEVVVVDDGSTDGSRAVIAAYGDRVVPVLKPNGGQASAFNAGFAACRGELICLLDADDLFYPTKVEAVVDFLSSRPADAGDALVFHDLEIFDATGTVVGHWYDRTYVRRVGLLRNYYEFALKYRYFPFPSTPTSGITIARALAEKVFPLPEGFPSGADNFVARGCALLGTLYMMDGVYARYRQHDANFFYAASPKKGGWESSYPKAFWDMEERFLNERLCENGLAPTIAHYRSLWARDFYRAHGSWKDMLRLAVSVPQHHLDFTTARFGVKTSLMAMAMLPGRLYGYHNA